MGITSHFIHTCSIERAGETQDEYGENVKTWVAHLTDVPCRLAEKQEREATNEFAEQPLITVYLLLVSADTDVVEDDRVRNITYEDGTTDARVFTVETKLIRRARAARHISLRLERVR